MGIYIPSTFLGHFDFLYYIIKSFTIKSKNIFYLHDNILYLFFILNNYIIVTSSDFIGRLFNYYTFLYNY